MADVDRHVTVGVDTHADVHVAAVLDSSTTRLLGTRAFETTLTGFDALLRWMRSHGELDAVGVEGTGSYGAGLSRYLRAVGVEVREVDRQDRKARRLRGKSDTVDAEAAARAVLSGQACGVPKSRDGKVEAIRVLKVVDDSAEKEHTQAVNQFHALVMTAPAPMRARLEALSFERQLDRAQRFTDRGETVVARATRVALRELARRITFLEKQRAELSGRLRELVAAAAPALVGKKGVGIASAAALLVAAGDNPERMRTEASFASLCGSAPVPASSGKTVRHRLSRGGNRQANRALWRIVMVRMAHDPRTQAYVARRTAEGLSKREIMRCLKRYVAREVFHAITKPSPDLVSGSELREMRMQAGMSLRMVAAAIGTTSTRLSKIERCFAFDSDLCRSAAAFIAADRVVPAAA